jgi:putative transcriptional regulator
MGKQARVKVADELVASVREMGAIMAGEVAPARAWHPPAHLDVRALRTRLGLSQPAFASRFGFSVGAVRDWEQGRRQPDPAARTLLVVIEHDPEAVTQALDAAGRAA